jgi:hypothetical protein
MPMSEKPMGVMALSILAIFLGIMGILGGAMGLVGLLFNQQTAPPDQNPKLTELNTEFEQRMKKLTDESTPVTKVVSPLVMLTSAMLVAAGIAGIKLQGLAFIRLALALNLVMDAIAAVFGIMVQMKTSAIMTWYFREAGKISNMPGAFATGMQVGMYIGVFFGAGWLMLKAGYYVWGLIYFSRKSGRQHFEARTPAPITT